MTTSGSASASVSDPIQSGFLHWISVQRSDLDDLLQVLAAVPQPDAGVLRRLAQKSIQHLNEYQQSRSGHHGSDVYSPSGCSSFENSLYWMGGFKPSSYIRLVYSISGIGSGKLELKLSKLVDGEKIASKRVVECSDAQVKLIRALYEETVSSEVLISSRVANLQECVMIEPLIVSSSDPGLGGALAAHRVAFDGIVADVDELRVKVFNDLIHILTPLQGIHLLVASTRLHLYLHEWGTK